MYCIILYCIVLYSIVLYCIALHCIALLGSGNSLRVRTAVILSNKGAHLGVGKTVKRANAHINGLPDPECAHAPTLLYYPTKAHNKAPAY